MSLINDALKKAQKQRTGGLPPLSSVPGVGGERAAEFSSRGRGSSGAPMGLILGVGLGAVGLLALGVAGFLFLRSRPDAPAATPERPAATVAASPAATAATPATSTSATPAPAPAKENVFVLPVAPPAHSPAPAATVASAPAHPAAQPKAAATAPTPQPATPSSAAETARPAGRLEPRAIQFIDGIRVAGIRASATDSKVLMNDRVYRAGDIVEHEMGLRLVGITTSSLTFEDDRGGRYTRNF
jgi:hypothetical protein